VEGGYCTGRMGVLFLGNCSDGLAGVGLCFTINSMIISNQLIVPIVTLVVDIRLQTAYCIHRNRKSFILPLPIEENARQ